MYKTIMVPVGLKHAERFETALRTASDLACHYGATVRYVAGRGARTETKGRDR